MVSFLNEPQHPSPIVNVAMVPQRSPFRYPGGKTWLVPRIQAWLRRLPSPPAEFIEPFVGGGSISLSVAFEQLAQHVTMVERDAQVAAVWQTIIDGDGGWLAEQIALFDLTAESVATILSAMPLTIQEEAFQTILRNRVNHGGILAPGAGTVNSGEHGKGLKSRWYPQTLKQRILNIMAIRERITFISGDGLAVLRQHAQRPDAVFFIDPPYTASGKRAGRRLYTCSELDHGELFRIASTLRGDFLMTYDHTAEMRELAQYYGFDTQLIAMKNTHHAAMSELLIGRNLDWAR